MSCVTHWPWDVLRSSSGGRALCRGTGRTQAEGEWGSSGCRLLSASCRSAELGGVSHYCKCCSRWGKKLSDRLRRWGRVFCDTCVIRWAGRATVWGQCGRVSRPGGEALYPWNRTHSGGKWLSVGGKRLYTDNALTLWCLTDGIRSFRSGCRDHGRGRFWTGPWAERIGSLQKTGCNDKGRKKS